MENKDPIEEARRYVANAQEVIKKANYDPELKSYTDGKYIKTAGNILWKGCLIAIDAVFHVRKGKGRPSIDKSKKLLANAIGNCCSMSSMDTILCICSWVTMALRTRKCVIRASSMPTIS